jgi:hypothetical protein
MCYNRVNICLKSNDGFISYKKKPKFNPIFYCLRQVDMSLYRFNAWIFEDMFLKKNKKTTLKFIHCLIL